MQTTGPLQINNKNIAERKKSQIRGNQSIAKRKTIYILLSVRTNLLHFLVVVLFCYFLPHHVISHLGEERLLDKIGVVCFEKFLGGLLGLHGGQFVSLGFESADDVTDNSALDSIGFDLEYKRKQQSNNAQSNNEQSIN
jgi:hypothetical protein